MEIAFNEARGQKRAWSAVLCLLSCLMAAVASSCTMPIIEIVNPDLAAVRDGTWEGYYDAELVKAKVAVVMEAHVIKSVTVLEHDCSSIGKKAERIVNDIVAQQSLDVDVVSGATGSSQCILKATELALRRGME